MLAGAGLVALDIIALIDATEALVGLPGVVLVGRAVVCQVDSSAAVRVAVVLLAISDGADDVDSVEMTAKFKGVGAAVVVVVVGIIVTVIVAVELLAVIVLDIGANVVATLGAGVVVTIDRTGAAVVVLGLSATADGPNVVDESIRASMVDLDGGGVVSGAAVVGAIGRIIGAAVVVSARVVGTAEDVVGAAALVDRVVGTSVVVGSVVVVRAVEGTIVEDNSVVEEGCTTVERN